MVRLTMDRERMKYLFREILGVDVDDVVRKVVATIAVERAKQAQQNTKEWMRYMEAEGGIVILPSNVTHLGRREPKPYAGRGAVRGTLPSGATVFPDCFKSNL